LLLLLLLLRGHGASPKLTSWLSESCGRRRNASEGCRLAKRRGRRRTKLSGSPKLSQAGGASLLGLLLLLLLAEAAKATRGCRGKATSRIAYSSYGSKCLRTGLMGG